MHIDGIPCGYPKFHTFDRLDLLKPLQGSARQLFQRLQGPMEEDTLKSHFEKIIKLGQKQHYRRNQVSTNCI